MLLHLFALSCQTVPLSRRNQMGIKKACLSSFWNTWSRCSDSIRAQRERPPQQRSNPASIPITLRPRGRQIEHHVLSHAAPHTASAGLHGATLSHQTLGLDEASFPFSSPSGICLICQRIKGIPISSLIDIYSESSGLPWGLRQ